MTTHFLRMCYQLCAFKIAGGDGGIAHKGILDSSRVHPQWGQHMLEEVHSKVELIVLERRERGGERQEGVGDVLFI